MKGISCLFEVFFFINSILFALSYAVMVTGIGFCGRRGKRKRERHMRLLSEHPERFIFYSQPKRRERKIVFRNKDGSISTKKY